MKTTGKMMIALLMLGWAIPATGQHENHQAGGQHTQTDSMMQEGMSHEGMMQKMHSEMMGSVMNDPLKRSGLLIRVIPTLAEELNLSDEQSTSVEKIAKDYRQQTTTALEQAEIADRQVQELLDSGGYVDVEHLKTLLRSAATSRADIVAQDYETAGAMKNELTDEQLAKLADMTPAEMHRQMMANMTMSEMAEVMQCDMMPGMMGAMPASEMHNMNGHMDHKQEDSKMMKQ